MPALSNLMKRWGFVKLSRYGLVLTPEGRIMSLRPAVLDDGLGGRIVGWEDADLAAAELPKWEPARPAPAAAVAARVASPAAIAPLAPPPIPKAPVRMVTASHATASAPLPALTPAARVVAPPAPVVIAPPAAVATAPVAPAEDAEDDWEWTIAIARARAAAEEVAAVAAPAPAPRKTRAASVPPPPVVEPPKFIEAKTVPSAAPPPLPASTMPSLPPAARSVTRTAPMPSVSGPMESGRWPSTEPTGTIDYNDYSSPAREVARMTNVPKATPQQQPVAAPLPPNRLAPRARSPVTVIPVPKLPSIKATEMAKLEPVTAARRLAAVKTMAPRTTTAQMKAVALDAQVTCNDDRTKPGITIPAVGSTPPANEQTCNDDRTKPGITLPRAATPVALPSITRRRQATGV